MEQITGVFTGSDMSIDRCFRESMLGMLGTNHVCDDQSVWITKTHFPLQFDEETSFKAQKMFSIVRNPIDVFLSNASLQMTNSHSL